MTKAERARAALAGSDVGLGADFHALSGNQVIALKQEADWVCYRRPPGANGSRLRSFHTYLQRLAQKVN